ncbi:MAG: IS200/IS605 family transposase [Bacteroidota bacterium]|nr:IS200/IS605 family transposase [Bacteroidota bacterium]MDP4229851.1 IS200/IS605 family transposase [Bacteroidota bacterium]MDP4234974.1 IS200/IS605 family transposase [Bacteroidota bacterium]
MSHSYISIYSHLVFSTKNREAFLTPVIRERLWRVMAGIMKNNGIDAITIGGYEDHCHALLSLPSTIPIAEAAKKLKGISSKWLSEEYPELRNFEWQKGYAAFSVSTSQLKKVIAYINNQEEHHKAKTFRDEYISFLRGNNIPFDEKYI